GSGPGSRRRPPAAPGSGPARRRSSTPGSAGGGAGAPPAAATRLAPRGRRSWRPVVGESSTDQVLHHSVVDLAPSGVDLVPEVVDEEPDHVARQGPLHLELRAVA